MKPIAQVYYIVNIEWHQVSNASQNVEEPHTEIASEQWLLLSKICIFCFTNNVLNC